MPLQDPQIDWGKLAAWVQDKQDYESQHAKQAPLSQIERDAIYTLIPPPQPRLQATGPDDKNWISVLNHYLQVRHPNENASFKDHPVNVPKPGNGKGFDVRWRCACTLPGGEGPFPTQTGDTIFIKKQDAKQFAAKTACDHLIANNQMSPSGTVLKVVVPAKRPRPPEAGSSSSVNGGRKPETNGGASLRRQGSEPSTPRRKSHAYSNGGSNRSGSGSGSNSDYEEDGYEDISGAKRRSKSPRLEGGGPSIESPSTSAKLVSRLTGHLGLPMPRYVCAEDPDRPNFWSVRIKWSDDPNVPEGLGRVDGILTRKAAREKSAELAVEWLEKEFEKRMKEADEFLEGV